MPFTFTLPKLSPTMEEGTIAKWHKKEGEYIEAGEIVLEIATDKATVEHEAIDEGWLRKILIPEGGSAIVNQPIAIFTEEQEESIEGYEVEKPQAEAPPPIREEKIAEQLTQPTPATAAPMSQPSFVPEPPLEKEIHVKAATKKQPASPLAKRLAKEQGLDIATVQGSGPGGRVTKKDLEHAQPAGVVTFGSEAEPDHAPGSYEEIPLSPMRKIIGKRLQESKSYVPHFYVRQIVDAQPLITLRKQLKAHNLKVTFNDLIIRAVALALRKHPSVNAGFNSVNQTLIQFKTIDISVAVTVEGGLITPIIRHADYKNIGQISTEVRALAERARAGKLQEQEYKGGSFCVSNLGMYGISEFTAVINPPQAAILAIGGIEDKPVVHNDQIIPGKELVLNLSADHRVIDGALGAQFMKTLQYILENPIALTLT